MEDYNTQKDYIFNNNNASISQLKQYPEILSLISADFIPMLWSFPSPGNYEITLATVFQYCGSHEKDAGTSSVVVQKDDEWLRAHSIQRLREEFEQPGENRIHQTKV